MRNCPHRVSTKASVFPRFSVSRPVALLPHELLPFYLANCGPSVVLCVRPVTRQGSLQRPSISRTVALQSCIDLSHELWPLFLTACCHVPRPSVSPTVALLPHELLPFYRELWLCCRSVCAIAQCECASEASVVPRPSSHEPLPFCLTNC